jgi:hypothetical protein
MHESATIMKTLRRLWATGSAGRKSRRAAGLRRPEGRQLPDRRKRQLRRGRTGSCRGTERQLRRGDREVAAEGARRGGCGGETEAATGGGDGEAAAEGDGMERAEAAAEGARRGGCRRERNCARERRPRWGAAAWHVRSGLPSVHLLCRDRPSDLPAAARLPRLVARGYTGVPCSVRTLRPVTNPFLRRIRCHVKPCAKPIRDLD